MNDLAIKARENLENVILPFWKSMIDREYGGFYGLMDLDLNLYKQADKGCILNSRILWFFSNAYLTLKDENLLEYAKHAYDFLINYCIDKENGGVFWSMSYDGKPVDTTKHTYNQAFAIYALSSYYTATKDTKALDCALTLYNLIERKMKDEFGYLEAFKVDFSPESNEKLSENGIIAEKTMNTLLHVIEAYTELYRVSGKVEVKNNLITMLNTIKSKIYNKSLHRQEVFFDREYNSLVDLHSYGHDIETSWLVDRCLEVIDDKKLNEEIYPITSDLCNQIYKTAFINKSVVNECYKGIVDTTRVWWVQAEAVVGFVNGYEKSKDARYLNAAKDILEYTLDVIVDKRPNSEWIAEVDEFGHPTHKFGMADPWKCPYHNGRMCIELINRA